MGSGVDGSFVVCIAGARGINGGFISCESSKKSYLGVEVGLEVPYGKVVSLKVT